MTHALDEVAQLADSVVLIEAGRVIGSGPLSEIAARADLPLAQRDDAGALLLCRVMEHDVGRELTRLEGGGATFWVPLLDAPLARRTSRPHSGARGDPGRQGRPMPSVCTTSCRATVRRISGRRGTTFGPGGDRIAGRRSLDLPGHARCHRAAGAVAGRPGAGADQVHLDRGFGKLNLAGILPGLGTTGERDQWR